MKKTITAISLLALVFVSAPNVNAEKCEALEELARVIMKSRQKGIQMSTLVKAINQGDGSADGKKAVKALIIEAYDQPNYHTDEMEKKAVNEFGNEVYKYCIKNQLDD